MADKNQKIIDQAIDQEYKYGFTTDIEQTKFEPGLDEGVEQIDRDAAFEGVSVVSVGPPECDDRDQPGDEDGEYRARAAVPLPKGAGDEAGDARST